MEIKDIKTFDDLIEFASEVEKNRMSSSKWGAANLKEQMETAKRTPLGNKHIFFLYNVVEGDDGDVMIGKIERFTFDDDGKLVPSVYESIAMRLITYIKADYSKELTKQDHEEILQKSIEFLKFLGSKIQYSIEEKGNEDE